MAAVDIADVAELRRNARYQLMVFSNVQLLADDTDPVTGKKYTPQELERMKLDAMGGSGRAIL